MKKLVLISLLLVSNVYGAEDIDNQLNKLHIPSDRVTPLVSKDKLYIINSRYSPLSKRHEIILSGANDFASEGHLVTKQQSLSYQFHLNDTWGVGLRYNKYFNELSEAGKVLFKNKAILADSDFAYNSKEFFTTYNTIYGKVRFSKNQVVYFDQFISLGLGKVQLESGEQNFTNLDLGLSFWIGKKFSFKSGIRNEFYTQRQITGTKDVHNAMGYLSLGYLFGGEQL